MKRRIIPLPLCEYILKKRLSPYFQVYIHLNLNNNGYCKKSEAIVNLGFSFGLSRKTVYNRLNRCIDLNWLGECDGKIYIRGINWLCNPIHMYTQRSILVGESDIPNIKEMMFSGLITSLINTLKWIDKKHNGGIMRRLGKSKMVPYQRPPFPLSNSVICNKYGFTDSHVRKLKKMCRDIGYIGYIHHLEPYICNKIHVNACEFNFHRKYNLEEGKRLRIVKGKVYYQFPNLFWSNISLRKRRRNV